MHTVDRTSVSFTGDKSKKYGDSRFVDSRFGDSRFVESRFSGSLSLGKPQKPRKSTLIITVGALFVTAFFIALAFLLRSAANNETVPASVSVPCSTTCKFQIVETLPDVLQYPSGAVRSAKIVDNLMRMVAKAKKSIDIASSYWTMRDADVPGGPYAESAAGETLFDALHDAVLRRGIKLRIVQQVRNGLPTQNDTAMLATLPNVDVRTLNMTQYFGSGITHTKMWIVDQEILYVGSANTDWRSYSVVKELGVIVDDCSCVGVDASKVFEVFWMLAKPGQIIPKDWPSSVRSVYNKDHPIISTDAKNISTELFITTSPWQLCPPRRTSDIDGLLRVIESAKKFVHVAVMDYAAATLYKNHNSYWAVIDDALRAAAFDRNLTVRILASSWQHTSPQQAHFLKSLQDLSAACDGSIEVKLFTFPSCSKKIPFSCVNHNKYMVTDNAAFIGTSNWSADYFISTTGVSVVFNSTDSTQDKLVEQVQNVFDRDWKSTYAKSL